MSARLEPTRCQERTNCRTIGNRSFFDLFRAKHGTELGDWREQYRKRIHESALFVPVCTTEYAAPGSISADQLAWTQSCVAEGHLRIAPAGVPKETPAAWPDCRTPHAMLADEISEYDPNGDRFGSFARICLSTVV
ncbi:MAG TPA: hypothetical protein VHG53_07895 [Candidatus Limnocylindria bacterium]|nr:hypothetical protein [Candidatus Limnocylindria bacterium]